MQSDALMLYKLIILYILDRMDFPITNTELTRFILEKEYTTFLTLQQVISELTEANLINARTVNNRTHLQITEEGRETLYYFDNRINDTIKSEINNYFHDNEFDLREEVSVLSNYYKSTSGEYEAHLIAKERENNLVEIKLSVPTREVAESICDNWQKKNQEVYQELVRLLF